MATEKNKIMATGQIVKKRCIIFPFIFLGNLMWDKYWIKIRGVEEPLTYIGESYADYKEGDSVDVEYDPKKPKKCKILRKLRY